MIISVASGKGGTGKTTVAVNLALALGDCQLLDCDVEEPNAQVFLKADIRARNRRPSAFRKSIIKNVTSAENAGTSALITRSRSSPGRSCFFPDVSQLRGLRNALSAKGHPKETDRTIGEIETGIGRAFVLSREAERG